MGYAPPTLRAGLDDPFYLRVFCDVWLSQHITPHSCCVQWCIWDKSSSRSSLYHSLHLILCFSICHIQASQKVASAHSGWWGWGSPGGSIHTPHVWPGRGWGASAQPGPQGGSHSCHSPQQEAGSKALKTPKGLVGIFTYSMAIGGFSQQEKPQVCKKRKNSKKAAGTKSGFSSGCNTESRTAVGCAWMEPIPMECTITHMAAPELPLSHTASFRQHYCPVGMHLGWAAHTTALKNWNDNMQVFPFLSFVLNWKIKCLCPIVNYS